jgi:hypothetical protein
MYPYVVLVGLPARDHRLKSQVAFIFISSGSSGTLKLYRRRAAFGWQGRVGRQVLRRGQVLDSILWHDTVCKVVCVVVHPR